MKTYKMNRNDIQVCLVFPEKSEHQAAIEGEVRAILSSALREQLCKKNQGGGDFAA